MVMDGNLSSEYRGFESRRHILDGHFSQLFVVKNCALKKTKINEKEAGTGTFLKSRHMSR